MSRHVRVDHVGALERTAGRSASLASSHLRAFSHLPLCLVLISAVIADPHGDNSPRHRPLPLPLLLLLLHLPRPHSLRPRRTRSPEPSRIRARPTAAIKVQANRVRYVLDHLPAMGFCSRPVQRTSGSCQSVDVFTACSDVRLTPGVRPARCSCSLCISAASTSPSTPSSPTAAARNPTPCRRCRRCLPRSPHCSLRRVRTYQNAGASSIARQIGRAHV